MTPQQARRVAHIVRTGGVIAYPTEAVFGLGCDPDNRDAVHRLLALKRRPAAKGLILIAAGFEQLEAYLQPLDAGQRATVMACWPGPVTWLLPVRPGVPRWLRGRHPSLAVRVTAHPVAADLCRACGGPLVSTSANLSGRPPARTVLAVRRQLGQHLDTIVAGRVGGAPRPSEIRDLASGRVLRRG